MNSFHYKERAYSFSLVFILISLLFHSFSCHRMAIGQTMSVRRKLATFVKEKLYHK